MATASASSVSITPGGLVVSSSSAVSGNGESIATASGVSIPTGGKETVTTSTSRIEPPIPPKPGPDPLPPSKPPGDPGPKAPGDPSPHKPPEDPSPKTAGDTPAKPADPIPNSSTILEPSPTSLPSPKRTNESKAEENVTSETKSTKTMTVSITSHTLLPQTTTFTKQPESTLPPVATPALNSLNDSPGPINFVSSTPGILLFTFFGLILVLGLFLLKKYYTPPSNRRHPSTIYSLSKLWPQDSKLEIEDSIRSSLSPHNFWLETDTETGKLKINRIPSALTVGSSDWDAVFANAKKNSAMFHEF